MEEQLDVAVSDVFDRKCCQVDCYTLIDCKLAYSEQCTSAPVECATGKHAIIFLSYYLTISQTNQRKIMLIIQQLSTAYFK